jgi:ABC-type phosphate/phosphonate transport system substrate-binding protein
MSLPVPERRWRDARTLGATELEALGAGALADAGPVAALAMYDLPELMEANDRLWASIAERLRASGIADVPARLTRGPAPEAVWAAPGLLLAQACGYPYMKALRSHAALVATPQYEAAGCEGPFHRSAIVVRKGQPAAGLAEMRGARLALNGPTSGSGMNLLRAAVAPHAQRRPFFASVAVTGSHLASVEAIAAGAADLAAIDAVTWAHLETFRPGLTGGLRVLGWTDRSACLPLITARTSGPQLRAALVEALEHAAHDPALAETRRTLRLQGFHVLPEAHYSGVLAHEQLAADFGYPVLA